MKKLIILALFCVTNSGIASAEIKTVTLDIPKMDCALCPITVETALKKVKGVDAVVADLDTKSATVSYDDSIADVQELIAATTDAGYPSEIRK